MDFKDNHVLSTKQFERIDVEKVLELAEEMQNLAEKNECSDIMKGKILATLFFEPSTRTRFSFETAMLRMGGQAIVNHNMLMSSSITKGETLFDTAQMVSRFADVIAMRHREAGSVTEFSQGSSVPVINGGDGPADHPTQGLLDLYTIKREMGAIDGLTIGLIGDLKYSRVFHSQARLLANYKVKKLVLISPKELSISEDIIELLKEKNIDYEEGELINDFIADLDVISTNRIQEERFADRDEYERLKKSYIFNKNVLSQMKEESILLNPLPRVDEIDPDIDCDSRCKYFQQVTNGIAVRMALLRLVLGV